MSWAEMSYNQYENFTLSQRCETEDENLYIGDYYESEQADISLFDCD